MKRRMKQDMERRSRRPAGATRTALLEAARELIRAAATPGDVTVRQVCQGAGANLAAVNYHFGSKEALVRDAVRLVIAGRQRTQEAQLAGAGRGPERAAQLVASLLFEEPVASRLALDAEVEAGGRGASLTRGALDELARQLAAASPGRPLAEVRLKAWALVAAVQQLFLRAEGCQEWLGVDPSDPPARDALVAQLAALVG